MKARRGIAALMVLSGLAACGGGTERTETAAVAPAESVAPAPQSPRAAGALPPFAGAKVELQKLFIRMRAAHAIQVGVRATGRHGEESTTEIFFNPVSWRVREGRGAGLRDRIFDRGHLLENFPTDCHNASVNGRSGWLLVTNPVHRKGTSGAIVARLAPVSLPTPLDWLQRTEFTARTPTAGGYTLVGKVRSGPEFSAPYFAWITMLLDRAGLPTEYALHFTERKSLASTYAVTFRYDDVPEIPHIAHARPAKGVQPCDAFSS